MNNFQPTLSKIEKEREVKENIHRSFNLSFSYTHNRCEKVAAKIKNLIKNVTPDFKLNFC